MGTGNKPFAGGSACSNKFSISAVRLVLKREWSG